MVLFAATFALSDVGLRRELGSNSSRPPTNSQAEYSEMENSGPEISAIISATVYDVGIYDREASVLLKEVTQTWLKSDVAKRRALHPLGHLYHRFQDADSVPLHSTFRLRALAQVVLLWHALGFNDSPVGRHRRCQRSMWEA